MSSKIPQEINEIITQKNSTESLISHLFDSLYLNMPKTAEEIREHNENLNTIIEELEHCSHDCQDILNNYANSKAKYSQAALKLLTQLRAHIIPQQHESKQNKQKQ